VNDSRSDRVKEVVSVDMVRNERRVVVWVVRKFEEGGRPRGRNK
jgi:hypothetical protein